jgi:hypothetical protein
MRSIVWLTLGAAAAWSVPNVASATPPARFDLLVVPIDFADADGDLGDPVAFETLWEDGLESYYAHVSNGALDLHVDAIDFVFRVPLPQSSFGLVGDVCRRIHPGVWEIGAGNPIGEAEAFGDIEVVDGMGIRPAGTSDDASFYEGILFVQVPPVAGCPYVTPFYGCVAPSLEEIAGVNVPPLLVGYDMADASQDCLIDLPRDYGGAAHELGHMLAFPNLGHPSQYQSRFELMDSGNDPNAPGVFTRWDAAFLDGRQEYFNGWLPATKVVEFSPAIGWGTEVLSPVEWLADDATSPQGLKVATGGGDYYVVECRRTTFPDAALPTAGTVIYRTIDEELRELELLDPAGPLIWDPTMIPLLPHDSVFLPGDYVSDEDNDLFISVGSDSGDGCTVTVVYGPGSAMERPDLGIVPWLTPPENAYETIDLWIDSPCNDFHDPAAPEADKLRYGLQPGFADPTVVGNGDDPCVDNENRIYARVRNLGTAMSSGGALAHFEVTEPLGVGIRGPDGWLRVGTTSVPALAPGDYADVFVPWIPNVPPGAIIDREAFHSCMRLVIEPAGDDGSSSNHDGDREQENINYFEARLMRTSGSYSDAIGEIVIANDDTENDGFGDRTFELVVDSHLPAGWTLDIDGGQRTYVLPPGASKRLPVEITVPPGTALGASYSVDVSAYTARPNPVRGGHEWSLVSSLSIRATTVEDVEVGLDAYADPSWSSPSSIVVNGCLTAELPDETVMIDYVDPQGTKFSQLKTTDAAGCFTDVLWQPWQGIWEVGALWVGNDTHARAVSNVVGVGIGVDFSDGCDITIEAGCGDADTEACVCAADSYCCNVSWDSICVGEVDSLDCGSCGDACTARSIPGARSDAMEACVCRTDPYCCETAWDSICVGEVDSLGCGAC